MGTPKIPQVNKPNSYNKFYYLGNRVSIGIEVFPRLEVAATILKFQTFGKYCLVPEFRRPELVN